MTFTYDKQSVDFSVECLDTLDLEGLERHRASSYSQADFHMLCFSITDRTDSGTPVSLDNVSENVWLPKTIY